MQPRNRIKRWNIVPGDKVRLLVGKPSEKYMDEVRGKEGGWKVYTVSSVDMTRNRVYLNGLSVSVTTKAEWTTAVVLRSSDTPRWSPTNTRRTKRATPFARSPRTLT